MDLRKIEIMLKEAHHRCAEQGGLIPSMDLGSGNLFESKGGPDRKLGVIQIEAGAFICVYVRRDEMSDNSLIIEDIGPLPAEDERTVDFNVPLGDVFGPMNIVGSDRLRAMPPGSFLFTKDPDLSESVPDAGDMFTDKPIFSMTGATVANEIKAMMRVFPDPYNVSDFSFMVSREVSAVEILDRLNVRVMMAHGSASQLNMEMHSEGFGDFFGTPGEEVLEWLNQNDKAVEGLGFYNIPVSAEDRDGPRLLVLVVPPILATARSLDSSILAAWRVPAKDCELLHY